MQHARDDKAPNRQSNGGKHRQANSTQKRGKQQRNKRRGSFEGDSPARLTARQHAQKNPHHIDGSIIVTRRGMGFVPTDEFDEDIAIQPADLNTALHGDQVRVLVHPHVPDEQRGGEVVEVLERARTRFVGVADHQDQDGACFVTPDDNRFYTTILLPEEDAQRVEQDQKVLVEITKWTSPRKNPLGKLKEVLGAEGEHEVEMHAIVLEHGFETDFPPNIQRQAKEIQANQQITDQDERERRDMRDVPTCTIDPAEAKDFDDALSIRKLDNGNVEVGIHIADVTHYVQSGSPIDLEARNRGTSVYLVDRTIPMLPEELSNDVCSLNPGEDKLAFSAVFELDMQGHVHDRWFGETIIHSDKRFVYDEAQDIIEGADNPLSWELTTLNEIARSLRKERVNEGSIQFTQDEVKFELDDDGHPTRVYKKQIMEANELIEDYMLLANREVASHFNRLCRENNIKNQTFIYRIHETPDPEKIEQLGIYLRAMGYEFETNDGEVTAKQLNKLLEDIEGTPEEDMIKIATIRSMAKAIYSTKNIGHFGLSFKYYTHFTSPIRRYPDMMVHRIFKAHIIDDRTISHEELKTYEKLALQSSQREMEAVDAERESIKFKQVEYMADRIGQEFDAYVSGVAEFGIFVEEKETRAEGLLHISKMEDDFYTLDRENYRLIGGNTGKSYSLGDEVRVTLADADVESRQLHFDFAHDDPTHDS
jgi:ribonuclease R